MSWLSACTSAQPCPQNSPPAPETILFLSARSKPSFAHVSPCKSGWPFSHTSAPRDKSPALLLYLGAQAAPSPSPHSTWEPLPCKVKIPIPLSFTQDTSQESMGALRPTGCGLGQEQHPGQGGSPWPLQPHPSLVSGLRTRGRGAAHLGPGPGAPPSGAQLAVAGPAALGSRVIAVLGVHGARGVVVQGLDTAHGASLHACPPTAPTARLPLARDPPARAHSARSAPGETPVDGGKAACSSRRIFPESGRRPEASCTPA